jgi:hypothetical protein
MSISKDGECEPMASGTHCVVPDPNGSYGGEQTPLADS